MKNTVYALALIVFLSSCHTTEYVFLSVLQPAPVTLPPYIKNVVVANRSLPSDKTKVIDVVDKAFSLEGVNLDKEGAQSSITGLTDELNKNERFNNVKLLTNIDLRTDAPGMFSAPLPWETVQKICKENNADALFVLELFDTDSKIDYSINKVNINTPLGTVPGIEHQANMRTFVKTGWRIYDPYGKNLLDEFPITSRIAYSGRGINPAKALEALIGRKEAVKEVGNKTGHDYAFRIIPYWVRVSRDYYVRGSDAFRIARRKAQTGNWKDAGDLWLHETNNADRKVAGRACYNMAIISEINGDIDGAIQWASKSYENYNNRLALHYVNMLKDRKLNNAVLQTQQSE